LQQKYDSLLGEMNNRITTGLINNSILNTPNQPRTLVRHMNYQSVTPVGSLTPAQGLNSPIANTPRNFDITLGHSPNIPNLLIKDLTSTSITNESASIESMKQSLERQNRNTNARLELFNQYSKEKNKNKKLSETLADLNKKLKEYVPKAQERKKEITKIANECNNLSSQLNMRNEEIGYLSEEVQNLQFEKDQLSERLLQLDAVMDHNTSLIRVVESLKQSGGLTGLQTPTTTISSTESDTLPHDVPELIQVYTRVKAEQQCHVIKIQRLENQVKDLEQTKEKLLDSIKYIRGVNIRLKNGSAQKLQDLKKENSELKRLPLYVSTIIDNELAEKTPTEKMRITRRTLETPKKLQDIADQMSSKRRG
ncbi:9871_t:CDS:2, partial [Entrophospora sp. SA101]